MRLAILTRPGNSSPLILAHSLKLQLELLGHSVEISEDINVLNRLVAFKNNTLSFHFWLKEKIANYKSDRKTLQWLKKMDAVVICECIPNGFWKRLYNIEKLKIITQKPVLFYEVFYLGNAPTQIRSLKQNNDPLLERYNAHLFVSGVTEIREKKTGSSFCIGLKADTWNLRPQQKTELIALVDFAQPGYEVYRDMQIKSLEKAGIKYISLERRYSIKEIRKIYSEISMFFVQFPEAFGLPILECLCTGAQIFTPYSSWPMSWRLDENPDVHSPGMLPECFTVYGTSDDLLKKLEGFKICFDHKQTPLDVFDIFQKYYPHFYNGNNDELEAAIKFIKKGN